MRKILLVALTAAAMVSCSENEGFENESTMMVMISPKHC